MSNHVLTSFRWAGLFLGAWFWFAGLMAVLRLDWPIVAGALMLAGLGVFIVTLLTGNLSKHAGVDEPALYEEESCDELLSH